MITTILVDPPLLTVTLIWRMIRVYTVLILMILICMVPPLFDNDPKETDQILNDFIQENYSIKKVEDHMAPPPVVDLLATTIDQWGLKVPNKNEIKLAFDQCKIPNNVKSLAPIRINDIIYQMLPFKAKELDRQAKNQSAYYTHAMGSLTFIWHCFIKAEAWAIKNKCDPPIC